MKLINEAGEAVYYNLVTKHGVDRYVIRAINRQTIFGRDRQKRKSRTFTNCYQAESWLRRNGYRMTKEGKE